ncbi:MAG: PLP-dependent aminotransferase family protein [Marinilabiliaceae bacterium]|nr:PLP-dependent aminotransferase family protein [Marinilabiliaceae bacterium]
MNYSSLFSDTIQNVPRSFIREILKTAITPEVISFAGGLPNPDLFPVEAFGKATQVAIGRHGAAMFQYSNSEGLQPLREWICEQYRINDGFDIHPHQVLITNGSQQGLDLLAKVLINKGDEVMIEEPGYLGAIQSLAVAGARWVPVPLADDGIDLHILSEKLQAHRPKIFYTVPGFQNPSGICYSHEAVRAVAGQLEGRPMVIVEDTPYRELSFKGELPPSFYKYLPGQTVLLGSFSKTTVPGLRLGWMVAPEAMMDRLVVAKQAADLHTDIFSQRVLMQYLIDNDHGAHIRRIREVYARQCEKMVTMMQRHLPDGVQFKAPQGGMFIWAQLPCGGSSMALFHRAISQNVAFVPGVPFYTDGRSDSHTFRLNFTCSNDREIEQGIERLGRCLADGQASC